MRLALAFLLLGSLVANSYAAAAALEGLPLDGHTSQGVPVVRASYAESRRGRVNAHYDGTTELDHYRDFVNDPYVNTENLGQILSTRQRPELRSGRPAGDDDIWQNRRHRGQGHVQAHAQGNQQASSATWGRVPDPWNRRSASQNVRSAADSDALAQHRQQLERQRQSAAQYRHHQYYEGGDENWEVASRGEDHVTYRRRNPHRPYDRLVEAPAPQQHYHQRSRQSAGQEEGKVLARVVDLRSGDETLVRDNSRRNWNRQPELRSLDQSQMVREGDWVQAEKSDNHVTWRRVGTSGSGRGWTSSSSSSGPSAHESWRRNLQNTGNWVEASRSENHVTYRRSDSGHNDYVTARPTTARPTRRPQMELRTLDTRPATPQRWRGQHREGDWIQVEKTKNQMTFARAGSERTRGWHSGGLTYDTWWSSSDNDGSWVEVSRSEDHVTYRKIGSGLSDYKPQPPAATRATPELRSLDTSSGRSGWVRTSESDNHVTWRRVDASRQLGPVTARRDHYRDHEVVLRRDHYVQATPTQAYHPIHYYPIMNDQATA